MTASKIALCNHVRAGLPCFTRSFGDQKCESFARCQGWRNTRAEAGLNELACFHDRVSITHSGCRSRFHRTAKGGWIGHKQSVHRNELRINMYSYLVSVTQARPIPRT